MQCESDISRLPVPVLAHVLEKLGWEQALQSAAFVSTSWRAAAALSIHRVGALACTQEQAASISKWLQAHVATAAMGSNGSNARSSTIKTIMVQCQQKTYLDLVLPTQQLTALQDLDLKRMSVSTAAAGHADLADDDDASTGPVLDPALTALTSLQLRKCKVQLQGLPALTGLQRLTLSASFSPVEAAASNQPVLAEAMPQLQRLTALTLGGPLTHDAALVNVSSLLALQQLSLKDACCTADSFQRLPSSITKLNIDYYSMDADAPEDADLTFSPDSTPGICQLTALQDLSITGAAGDANYTFQVAALTALTSLTALSLWMCELAAADGEPKLSVLTALTRLQYLQLRNSFSNTQPPAVQPEDFSSIMSSAQLTHLELPYDLDPVRAPDLFPAQWQLLCLHELRFNIFWLADRVALQRVVTCCPNLRQVQFCSNGGDDVAIFLASDWMRSISELRALTELTSLDVGALDMELSAGVIAEIAKLTTLQNLALNLIDPEEVGSLMLLRSCTQLTRLWLQTCPWQEDEDGAPIVTEMYTKHGDTPDVWQQIPAKLLSMAATNYELYQQKPTAMRSLLRAAAGACSHALGRQVVVEQQVQVLEQHNQALTQQVAQLQDSMAAVLAHLQLPERRQ